MNLGWLSPSLVLAYPWALLLLALPWLLRRVLPPHREPRAALRAPFTARLAELAGREAATGAAVLRRRRTQWILLVVAWTLLTFALARPQWLEEPLVQELPMRDLLLAVDLSGSMETRDFTDASGATVDRLTAVKQVLDGFLAERDGDRVGLIFFGSAAFVQAPFTDDLEVVRELLGEAQVRMLGPRTMLGDAMGLAINLFERSEVEERVMIVLTDGNDTGSLVPPERAAEIARDQGVVVHTVAVGDPQAAGEQALDEATLRQVADSTGGDFFRAEDRGQLSEIYAELDALNPRQVETVSFRPRRELYPWPLGILLVTALLYFGAAELALARRRRPRSKQEPEPTAGAVS
jgi:Ca-activated chloride channel family protein